MIATVFGDVHDIGKSLVNTILTNNGYTVVDLGKQVPVDTIIDAASSTRPTAIGLSALLVSTSKQMPLAVQELHEQGPRVPGADRRRRDQPQLRPPRPLPEGQGVRRDLRARRLLLQGRVRGPRHDGPAGRRRGARRRWSTKIRAEAKKLREKPVEEDTGPPTTDDSVRSPARTDVADPRRRRSGACARSRSTSTRCSPTSTATCCSSSTGAARA